MEVVKERLKTLDHNIENVASDIRSAYDEMITLENQEVRLGVMDCIQKLHTKEMAFISERKELTARIIPAGVAISEDFKRISESVSRLCAEKLSQTRCASKISRGDLQDVRDAFKTILRVRNDENNLFKNLEEYWNERYEVQAAANYLETVRTWAPSSRNFVFKDARGHVLRSAKSPLNCPISSSNDVVLILREYNESPEVGCFLGIQIKRGLATKGLRQAEIDFYLWGGCSLFPFVQTITDMQTGGAAFYKTGSSPAGHTITLQYLNGMDSVRAFVRDLASNIPDDAGQDGPNGTMKIPCTLSNPERKRRREDTPEPDGGHGGALGHQAAMHREKRGFEMIAAMQPDAGNDLLSDLDAFDIPPWPGARDAALPVS